MENEITKCCRNCKHSVKLTRPIPIIRCANENRHPYLGLTGDCEDWESNEIEICYLSLSETDINKLKNILIEVEKQGFDKVADELIFDPDYLGNARATVRLLEKGIEAANKVADTMKQIKDLVYKNY